MESGEARISDILFKVNRLGAMQPYVYIDPIKVGGCMRRMLFVKSLYLLKRTGLSVGDIVSVSLSGTVLIVNSIIKKGKNKEVPIPDKCPSCNIALMRTRYDPFTLVCRHTRCREKVINQAIFYCRIMCIPGWSKCNMGILYDWGVFRDFADIYTLRYKDFVRLPNFNRRRAMQMLYYINKSKCISGLSPHFLAKVLVSMSIHYWGWNTSKMYAFNFVRKGFKSTDLYDRLEDTFAGAYIGFNRKCELRSYFKYANNGVVYKRLVTQLGL